jgi:dipeptidase D
MKKNVVLFMGVVLVFITASCTKDTNNENMNNSLFDKSAYGHLLELLKVPCCSHSERAVSDYLVEFAKGNGLEVMQDESLNVLIRKPGSKGRENEPPVILQAHMDMVCEKNGGVTHDFLKDPIRPVVDGDWLKADGTTLGADNGAGVAMIMAVLESKNLSHPPVEAVITTREETDMGGAAAFDVSLLKGRRFINVDSEEERAFTVSSASTNDVTYTIPVKYEAVPSGTAAYTLKISGLTGGHSGVDIDKNRANANVLMGRLLERLLALNCQLSTINGGTAKNAIPRESMAVVVFAEDNLNAVTSAVKEAESNFKAAFQSDSGLKITLDKAQTPNSVMTAASASAVTDGITLIPNGVQSMSEHIKGLVQTSNNLGIVTTEGNAVTLLNMPRSSNLKEQDELLKKMEKLALDIGAQYTLGGQSPLWEYKEDSPLRDKMAEIYKEVFGKEVEIIAIHAGLECGMFALAMPDCEFISIGPDIFDAHSPDERLNIPSFNRMCDFLVKLLEQI